MNAIQILVEEHRLPGSPDIFIVWRLSQRLEQHPQLLRSGEPSFKFSGPLFQLNPAAVGALEDGIQFSADDRTVGTLSHEFLIIGGDGQAEVERRVGLAVELLNQLGDLLFGFTDIRPR